MLAITSLMNFSSPQFARARDIDAVPRSPQHRVEPMRSNDVHDLGRVRDHVGPAIGNAHLRKILQDIEADTLEYHDAGLFQDRQITEPAGRLFYRACGGDKYLRARMHLAPGEKLRQR